MKLWMKGKVKVYYNKISMYYLEFSSQFSATLNLEIYLSFCGSPPLTPHLFCSSNSGVFFLDFDIPPFL